MEIIDIEIFVIEWKKTVFIFIWVGICETSRWIGVFDLAHSITENVSD